MASRDHLKKIKKTMLLMMCEDIGIDVKGKKKEELVDQLFTNGVPALHITPVINQNSVFTGVLPNIDGQDMDALPPFNKCNFTSVPYSQLPGPTFFAIYNLLDPVLHAQTEVFKTSKGWIERSIILKPVMSSRHKLHRYSTLLIFLRP